MQNIGAYRINGEYVSIRNAAVYADSLGGRPSDFAYFGDYTDFDQWANLEFGGQHRDSEVRDRSNHAVIVESLEELCPDGFIVESASHWAVGWVASIRIDTSNLYAVAVALYWKNRLEDHPVVDEDHFSAMEFEEVINDWESWGEHEIIRELEGDSELVFYLNLDKDGDAEGFRNDRIWEFIRGIFEEKWQDSGGDISFEHLIGELRESLPFDIREENERREVRRLEKLAEYHKYQTRLEI